ncbi:hypothetical protein LTR78_001848 [Recurvomyces mirabilis]|uniref:General substrate transporter n=1 Tax=Recurvomyces mirabilis TaxID=574656 RepID=A0AAE0WW01_9PEZI|nr:hypothetical protein LTR78_001848 [Recurvomyces mirabilis]KAK5156712.1 hypothetical protein LTS14_004924 [Recurvomyces mirabilis]
MADSLEKMPAQHFEGADDMSESKAARLAAVAEHETTLWQALKSNKKAAMWSILLSTTIVMEGYDVGLIYQFFGYPSFARTFGNFDPATATYQISGPWQAGFANGANCGIIIGGFANGFLSQRYGYKRAMSTYVGPSVSSSRLASCTDASISTVPGAGEFATRYNGLGLFHYSASSSSRRRVSINTLDPSWLHSLTMIGPWWLVRNDRIEDAQKALAKLDNKGSDSHRQTLAQISRTLKFEAEVESGSSYFDCFKGTDLRRTEIVCMTFAGQVLSGSAFAYGPTYFFEQAGISVNNAYQIAVGGTGIAFIGTVLSWFLLSRFGRRTLYLNGMIALACLLLIVGIIASASSSPGAKWGQAALCLLWLFTYSSTVGPICYTIISETSSLRLRAKSVCLSRNVYNMTQIVANVIEPYLINPTEGNLKGKTAYFWFATACLTVVWAYFRLPECRGRTYEELDLMFHNKVSARKFASYEVDPYENEHSRE